MDPLRVLVVGDDPLARSGLASLLSGEPEVEVVEQVAATGDPAGAVRLHGARAAVWDPGLGPRPSLEGVGELQGTGVPVLALLHDETEAPGALAAGARGLLFRDADGPRLAAALRALSRGLLVLEEGLAESVFRPRSPGPQPMVETLTPRELEVLQLLAQGLTNRSIAQRLAISEHTVKFHVNAILGKLGAQSRTEALVQAARLGLVIL